MLHFLPGAGQEVAFTARVFLTAFAVVCGRELLTNFEHVGSARPVPFVDASERQLEDTVHHHVAPRVVARHVAEELRETCLDAEFEVALCRVQPRVVRQTIIGNLAFELFEALNRLHVTVVEASVLARQEQRARPKIRIPVAARDHLAERVAGLAIFAREAQRLGFEQARLAPRGRKCFGFGQVLDQRLGSLDGLLGLPGVDQYRHAVELLLDARTGVAASDRCWHRGEHC
jgi:hypothetical protein